MLTGNGLDTQYPYETVEQTAQDSPGAPLEDNNVEEFVDDTFNMWVMFKPTHQGSTPLQDSIWVPLKRVTWGWSATARRNAPGCNIGPPTPSWAIVSSNKKTISVVDTTEFPIWMGLANTNQWFQMSCP